MHIPNFRRSLLAVLLGNLLYFYLLPHLPDVLRHHYGIDTGLFIDFLICTALYIGFGLILRMQRRDDDQRHTS